MNYMIAFEIAATWFARILTGVLFLIAGIGKLLAPVSSAQPWSYAAGVPLPYAVAFFIALSILEIYVALGLLGHRGRLPVRLACGLSVVFFGFTVMRNLDIFSVMHCGCFGLLEFGPPGVMEVIRDGLLLSACLLLLASTSDVRVERKAKWRSVS